MVKTFLATLAVITTLSATAFAASPTAPATPPVGPASQPLHHSATPSQSLKHQASHHGQAHSTPARASAASVTSNGAGK